MPKSSVSPLISTLAERNLLYRTAEGRYRLGWRVMALSRILLGTTPFLAPARRMMDSLVSRNGELVHLAALEDGHVIYVEKLPGPRSVQVPTTGQGLTLPGHGSGVGKVLLAHRPWKEVSRTLDRVGLPELTPNTITRTEDLRSELEVVRERGYAYDREETLLDLACVAAPVRDQTGDVVAAMSFSVPVYRFEQGEERYRAMILEAAQNVSESLGYS